MNSLTSSSPSRPLFSRACLAPALMLSAGLMLCACHKDEAPKPAPETKEAPVASATEQPKPAPAPGPATAPAPEPAPAPQASADPAMDQRVKAFKAFHPFSTASQLFKINQFTGPLASLLQDTAKDPKLVERILGSGKMAAESKPFSGQPKINLKVDHSSPALTDGLLAAVLSSEPARLVDFVLAGVPGGKVEFIVLPPTLSSPSK